MLIRKFVMKIKKMASVFCVMILLLVCVISIQAFAETKVQDGLEVYAKINKKRLVETSNTMDSIFGK